MTLQFLQDLPTEESIKKELHRRRRRGLIPKEAEREVTELLEERPTRVLALELPEEPELPPIEELEPEVALADIEQMARLGALPSLDLTSREERITREVSTVYPDMSVEDFASLVEIDFDSFLGDMRKGGRTEEKDDLLRELGYSKDQIDFFYGVRSAQIPGEIPSFNDWVREKGFTPESLADDLRERGVSEELIPEMVAFDMSELRAVYEYDHDLGRWGTALGELDKIFVDAPQRLPELAIVFGRSLTRLPRQTAAAILSATQGQGGASVVDKDWADRFIERTEEDLEQFTKDLAEQYPNSQLMAEIGRLSQNLGFSITSMGAGLAVGVPIALTPVPGARVGAYVAGTAASGFVAYQMTTYQIMQTYLEVKDAEKFNEFGVGLSQFEEDLLKKEFHDLAVKYGLWEAIPEAISNLLFFAILTAPLTSMIGRTAATQIISKIAAIYGQELLTETITQKGQAAIEVKAGLREEGIGWVEAFKEIAPQTFLLTTVMAGAGQVIISSKSAIEKAKKSLAKEIGVNHPQYQELVNNIEENLDEAVTVTPTETPTLEEIEAIPEEILAIEPEVAPVVIPEVTQQLKDLGWTDAQIQELDAQEISSIIRNQQTPALFKPPVTPEVPIVEEVEVVSDDKGEIIPPPDDVIPVVVDANTPLIHDIGVKEVVRGTRHVFEKMGIYEIWDGVTTAEVDIHDANTAFDKEVDALAKTVGKDRERWGLIFDEVNEAGSVIGLTFEEKRVVSFAKKFYDVWADKKNIPQEKRIKNYITHLFEQEMIDQIEAGRGIPPEIASVLSQKVATKITDPFLKERLGAVGFLRDPFRSMKAYNSVSNRVLYYEPFLQKIAAIANDTSIPQRSREYLKDYSRRMTGEPSKLDLAINESLAEIGEVIRRLPGGGIFADLLTQGNPSGLAAYQMTSALYTLFLGFKVTTAIRNLSQHGLIIGEVGPKHFTKGIGLRFTEEGKAVLRETRIKRGRRRAFTPGIDASFADNWMGKFREASMYMFRGADAQNVSDAVLAGYSEAKEILTEANNKLPADKKLSADELRNYMVRRGDEVGMDTQFLYTKMNSMAISQNAPGRILSMLTTWTENWLELMAKWITRQPSKIYTEFNERTGADVTGANWSTSYKAIGMYLAIAAIAYAIKEHERLKALEYTGITSLRYLAGTVGGEFPALQVPKAIGDIVTGATLGDEAAIKRGWNGLRRVLTPGIVNQTMNVALGEKDWLTLFFYLEGKDFNIGKLKDKWQKGFKPYEDLSDPLIRAKQYPTLNANTARKRWREENWIIEAQMFVVGKFGILSSEEARAEVLRLIEKHKIDPELVDGYEKLFGIDTNLELNKSQKRIGSLEKLVIGEEAEYYDMGMFAEEVHKAVNSQGRGKVTRDGHALAIELLNAEDLWKPYFDYEEAEARKLYRQRNPDVEAQLYLWGKVGAFENPESATELLRLMEKYNIPPQAINAFQQDPSKYDELFTQKFEIEQKNFDLTTEYENFGNSEASNYIEDKGERQLARDKFKEDNPNWVADMRRIEAIDNDASSAQIEKWVERGKVIDEFNPTGSEAQAWLLDNPEMHKWALDNELLTDDGSDWNKDVIRLNVALRGLDEQYDDLPTEGDIRERFLLANPEYNDDRRRRTMFRLDASAVLVEEFVDYGHIIDAFSSGSSQAKLFRVDHPELTRFGEDEDTLGWEELDSADIPIWRIDVEFEIEDNEYQAILDKFEGTKEARKTDEYLDEHKEYAIARKRRDAYRLGLTGKYTVAVFIPELRDMRIPKGNPIDDYVDYTMLVARGKPVDLPDNVAWYEDDWFLMEHMPFYREVYINKDVMGNERKDWRKVPSRDVFEKYLHYRTKLYTAKERDDYRLYWVERNQEDFEDWLLLTGKVSVHIRDKKLREELTPTERFKQRLYGEKLR